MNSILIEVVGWGPRSLVSARNGSQQLRGRGAQSTATGGRVSPATTTTHPWLFFFFNVGEYFSSVLNLSR